MVDWDEDELQLHYGLLFSWMRNDGWVLLSNIIRRGTRIFGVNNYITEKFRSSCIQE